jgi:hypothetical protein
LYCLMLMFNQQVQLVVLLVLLVVLQDQFI